MNKTVHARHPRHVLQKRGRKLLSQSMPKLPAIVSSRKTQPRSQKKQWRAKAQNGSKSHSMLSSPSVSSLGGAPLLMGRSIPKRRSYFGSAPGLPIQGKHGYMRILSPQTSMSLDLPVGSKSMPNLPLNLMRNTLGQYKCPVCMQRFRRPGTLDVHKRALHPWTIREDGTVMEGPGVLPFKCEECGKRFATKEQIFSHKKLHTGAQVLSCGKCGKRMLVRRTGSKHSKVHESNYPPFDCVCGKRFKSTEALQDHLKHREVHRPFVCICGHKFKQQVTIKIREDVRESALAHMNEVGRRWTKLSFS